MMLPTAKRKMRGTHRLLVAGLAVVAGCAPQEFIDGVAWRVETRGLSNAAFVLIRHFPSLRANVFLADQLELVETDVDATTARERIQSVVHEARHLSDYAVGSEIDQLSDRDLRWLLRHYFSGREALATPRAAVQRHFESDATARFARLAERIRDTSSLAELKSLARTIRGAFAKSPKDRHGGGPLLAIVAASIEDDLGSLDRGGPWVDVYEPADDSGSFEFPAGRRREAALLTAFAPILVQENNREATYPGRIDSIGTVRARRRGGDVRIEIDTTEPSVYAYVQRTLVGDQTHLQLTYTYWFPEHPKLKAFDSQAGKIDGATLRITLDANDKPAVFETLLNCGCYHRCYPATRIEAAACDLHQAPLPSKRLCVERAIHGKIDWIVPETVAVLGRTSSRPILFSRAGWHGLAGVSFDSADLRDRKVNTRRRYRLRRYEELESLPCEGGSVSMFQANGLVRGAERLEGLLLAPTGMLGAGQPRQRGTQLLHWDQYDFDDPHLLDECLRLPERF